MPKRRPFWGLTWVGETKSGIRFFFGEKNGSEQLNNWNSKIDGFFKGVWDKNLAAYGKVFFPSSFFCAFLKFDRLGV